MGGPCPKQGPFLGAAWASEASAASTSSCSYRRARAVLHTPQCSKMGYLQLQCPSHRDNVDQRSVRVWGSEPQTIPREKLEKSDFYLLFFLNILVYFSL